MTKPLVLIGTGGMAREVRWIIEELNKQENKWNILGWVSQDPQGEVVAGLPVLGNDDWLLAYNEPIDVVLSVGDGHLRENIFKLLEQNPNISFPAVIAPSAEVSPYVQLGKGSIIMNKSLLTVDIKTGDFFLCNYGATIGHDCVMGEYVSINPGAHISGNVKIGDYTMIGAGATIIQGLTVGEKSIVGAGATVIRDVGDDMTVVGVPAKPIN